MSFSENQKVNILGVGINPINMSQAINTIDLWIANCKQNYVCVTPAHAIMECYHQPSLRRIFNLSGLTTPDGMSIVWLLKMFGYSHVERVYGPDLLLEVSERSQLTQWRHFFYGGAPEVAESLAEGLKFRYSNLQVAGTYSPPFGEITLEEDDEIINRINRSQPDIVWVGISSPKQEQWMYSHLGRVNAPVLIGVGAAFDFLSGTKKQAPRWIQRSGLEWLFRLFSEPRRLWRRYIQYPFFGLLVISQIMGLRRFPTD